MVNVNLDKNPLIADSIHLQLDSANLLLVDAEENTFDGERGAVPYYTLKLSINGAAAQFTCNKSTYDKACKLEKLKQVSVVLEINIRYKKLKAIDIG